MKFLIDAQLPQKLAQALQQAGYDALHTLELPLGNRTPDTELNRISLREQRVLVTKDTDFVISLSLAHGPYKLLLVSTGNINNRDLQQLFALHVDRIVAAFQACEFVELTRDRLIIHW